MNVDFQQLVRTLLDRDVYIARTSQRVPASIAMPGAIAFTGGSLDIRLRPWLQSRGKWRGRKSAIVIDDVAINQLATEAAEAHDLDATEIADNLIIGAVLHEAAHVVAQRVPSPDEVITPSRSRFAEALAAYGFARLTNSDRPPFEDHDQHFIRAALHLWHRAQSIGVKCHVEYLFNAEAYHVPPAEFLQYALGNEPANLEKIPIAELRTFQPPLQFVRAMQNAIAMWIAEQPADSPAIATAVAIRDDYPYPERIY